MVLSYSGIPCHEVERFWQRALAAEMNTIRGEGTTPFDLVRVMNQHLRSYLPQYRNRPYETRWLTLTNFRDEYVWTIGRHIYNSLLSNVPVVLYYSGSRTPLTQVNDDNENHFIVIYGIEATENDITFISYDPWDNQSERFNIEGLRSRIHNQGALIFNRPLAITSPDEEPEPVFRPDFSGSTTTWCTTFHPNSRIFPGPRRKRSTEKTFNNKKLCPSVYNTYGNMDRDTFSVLGYGFGPDWIHLELSTETVQAIAYVAKTRRDDQELVDYVNDLTYRISNCDGTLVWGKISDDDHAIMAHFLKNYYNIFESQFSKLRDDKNAIGMTVKTTRWSGYYELQSFSILYSIEPKSCKE